MSVTNYKPLWEELVELLETMEIPTNLWHRSQELRRYIFFERPFDQYGIWRARSLEILNELYPPTESEITKCSTSLNY